MTTLKDIKARYTGHSVEQVGSKQLFIVYTGYGKALVLSYDTIIGVYSDDTLFLTTEKYSHTTSRHCSELSRMYKAKAVKRVDNDELQLIVSANIHF